MRFAIVVISFWGLISMTMETGSMFHTAHPARGRVLQGPNGVTARFMDGVAVPYAGEEDTLYMKVEIVRPGKNPVVIHLSHDARIDGDDAASRNVAKKSVDELQSRPWSLDLWSCDGQYIVLTSVPKLHNGTWDFRNSLLSTYDTTSGQYSEFKGATSFLTTDTFVQWSPTDCGVAILRGSENREEARVPR